MKFIRLKSGNQIELVLEIEGELVSVSELLGATEKHLDLQDVFGRMNEIESSLKRGKFSSFDGEELRYAPIVGQPRKIICVGLNYQAHVNETQKPPPKYPVLFNKFHNTPAAHLDEIEIAEEGLNIDYEGELGVMIGSRAANVDKEFDRYIFGYYVGNDISSRTLQYRTSQFLLGKSLNSFYPNGPILVTRDELQNPQDLDITTRVNGSIRQSSSTSNMIFTIDKLIAYISHYIPLDPGDVISTGTPDGVIMGMKEEDRKWLSNGDEVEVEIEGIGTLKNSFVDRTNNIIVRENR